MQRVPNNTGRVPKLKQTRQDPNKEKNIQNGVPSIYLVLPNNIYIHLCSDKFYSSQYLIDSHLIFPFNPVAAVNRMMSS